MRDPGADSETEGKKTLQPHEGGGLQSDNQLDKAGQSILRLLHKAAGVTEQKNRRTLEMAQKLSHQVHGRPGYRPKQLLFFRLPMPT